MNVAKREFILVESVLICTVIIGPPVGIRGKGAADAGGSEVTDPVLSVGVDQCSNSAKAKVVGKVAIIGIRAEGIDLSLQ